MFSLVVGVRAEPLIWAVNMKRKWIGGDANQEEKWIGGDANRKGKSLMHRSKKTTQKRLALTNQHRETLQKFI